MDLYDFLVVDRYKKVVYKMCKFHSRNTNIV